MSFIAASAANLAAAAPQIAQAGIQAVTRGGPRRQYKWNRKAMREANDMNRANAEWQMEQQKRLLEEQRLYDSPEAQMARYKAAGLNPNLIYGSMSGGSAPIQFGNIAPARLDAPDASYPDIAGSFIQAQQQEAQIESTRARTVLSNMQSQLTKTKDEIERSNPMLNPLVYQAVTDAAWKAAQLKAATSSYELIGGYDANDPESKRIFEQKILGEINIMNQKLGLGAKDLLLKDADLKIKNEVFESKDYLNYVNELMKKWVEDGDVSWEHMRRGIMILLNGMLK